MLPKRTSRSSSSNNWTRPRTRWPRLRPRTRRTERRSQPNGLRYLTTIPSRNGPFFLAGEGPAVSPPLGPLVGQTPSHVLDRKRILGPRACHRGGLGGAGCREGAPALRPYCQG